MSSLNKHMLMVPLQKFVNKFLKKRDNNIDINVKLQYNKKVMNVRGGENKK